VKDFDSLVDSFQVRSKPLDRAAGSGPKVMLEIERAGRLPSDSPAGGPSGARTSREVAGPLGRQEGSQGLGGGERGNQELERTSEGFPHYLEGFEIFVEVCRRGDLPSPDFFPTLQLLWEDTVVLKDLVSHTMLLA
tara:strand:- start:869 stop:1276 length:408 start_codon:yes stop_codon:yes gene_type:complete